MGEPADEIGAAVPLRTLVRVGRERLAVKEQEVPPHHHQPYVERKGQVRLRRGGIDRCNCVHEIRVKRLDVVVRYSGVGRVRHRRIETRTVGAHAFAQRVGELRQRVITDAVSFRGRDIGRDNCAERRLQWKAASERLAAGGGVTGDAVAGRRKIATVLNEAGIGKVGDKGARIGARKRDDAAESKKKAPDELHRTLPPAATAHRAPLPRAHVVS